MRLSNLPYVYDDITKLCRQQAQVIQNLENKHVDSIGQGEALATVKLTTVQLTKLPFYSNISKICMISFLKPVLVEELYIVQKKKKGFQ
jgi:hypothetical protein